MGPHMEMIELVAACPESKWHDKQSTWPWSISQKIRGKKKHKICNYCTTDSTQTAWGSDTNARMSLGCLTYARTSPWFPASSPSKKEANRGDGDGGLRSSWIWKRRTPWQNLTKKTWKAAVDTLHTSRQVERPWIFLQQLQPREPSGWRLPEHRAPKRLGRVEAVWYVAGSPRWPWLGASSVIYTIWLFNMAMERSTIFNR